MATLLYIHGFLSSPQSYKAQQIRGWLEQNHPQIDYNCPKLRPYPDECAQILTDIISRANQPVYLMGSSLGGFWATWCAETYGLSAILINPAVNVLEFLPLYVNKPLSNYHTNEHYRLQSEHIKQMEQYDISPTHKENYWVLLQTGDETLDYRLAVAKYAGCRQTVETGGDHSFQGFERYFQEAIIFFGQN